jgi:hypothetical protein
MSVTKPYRRTCRQFVDGSYAEGGRWQYLLHKKFANEPQHFIRAFLMLQDDLEELFTFIEPADQNLSAYSHRTQQLLTRCCIEIEANLTAILLENNYPKASRDLTMKDYKLVEFSHRLSHYRVRIPGWRGTHGTRMPFSPWGGSTQDPLPWYQAYNQAKHDRHAHFHLATFDVLLDAMCGLAALLAAQFHQEDYSPQEKTLGVGASYSYDTDDGMSTSIGDFFRIEFPTNYPLSERYDFDWDALRQLPDPFDEFDHYAYA